MSMGVNGATPFVNTSAYGFCVFASTELPELRERLLASAHAITNESCEETLNGTILLTEEGINVQLSGTPIAVENFKDSLRGLHSDLAAMEFKDSYSKDVTLSRFLVKIKKEVIAMGVPEVQPAHDGLATHISPEEFKQWMDEDRDMLVLDTRNDYEVRLGTFENAIDPQIKSFRAFPNVAKTILKDTPKEKPIVMFCTGGVRCEKASYVLLNDGFKNVYQLDGGILRYFERVGDAHYNGDCYIFDKRITLKPDLTAGNAVACFKCRSPLDEQDQARSEYVPGKHCPYCVNGKTDFRHVQPGVPVNP